ncbi:F-box/FBD/LRR-repeat protein-like protein [Tanacetum coccineum]
MDRISKLPPAITETILCLVPIEAAARTSVLSKEWRYTWTKIPKLVFNEHMFEVKGPKQKPKMQRKHIMSQVPRKFLTTIGEVLKMHDGTIDEFTLEMNTKGSFGNIAWILDCLSEKSVKKLKLKLFRECALPSSLFTWTHLTDLCLMDCRLYYEYHELTCGDSLGSLTTLYLKGLTGSTKDLVYFLSKCPSLKTVTMLPYPHIYVGIRYTYRTTIIDMFQCLRSIENLSISSRYFECFSFVPGGPQKLPTVHLKYCRIEDMCFNTRKNIPMLGLLIISSPNLVRLVVELKDYYLGKSESGYFKMEDYSDIWLEHLTELKIENMSYKTNAELDFVKLILARSRTLMKVNIVLYRWAGKDVELQILEVLSSSLHASPTVEIVVECHPWELLF